MFLVLYKVEFMKEVTVHATRSIFNKFSIVAFKLLFARYCFVPQRSAEALSKNKTLITPDQRAYQKELEKNYKVFVDKLEPLLKKRFGTLRGSLRKK